MSRHPKPCEYEAKAVDLCKIKNLTYGGFKLPWAGSRTKLLLTCLHHDYSWDSTSFQGLSYLSTGCKYCVSNNNKVKQSNTPYEDSLVVERLLKLEVFEQGTLFWRSLTGPRGMWEYSCPSCSTDIYVQNNLCTGVFKALQGNLLKGGKACRCGPKKVLTLKQLEFDVLRILDAEPAITFLGWYEELAMPSKRRIKLNCATHGNWTTHIEGFLKGTRCPVCSKKGYKQNKSGCFYILKVEGNNRSFTGFGISNNFQNRLRQHNKILNKLGLSITKFEVFSEDDGQIPLQIESNVKRDFTIVNQNIIGFMREAVNVIYYDNLVEYVKKSILERNKV